MAFLGLQHPQLLYQLRKLLHGLALWIVLVLNKNAGSRVLLGLGGVVDTRPVPNPLNFPGHVHDPLIELANLIILGFLLNLQSFNLHIQINLLFLCCSGLVDLCLQLVLALPLLAQAQFLDERLQDVLVVLFVGFGFGGREVYGLLVLLCEQFL